MGKLIKEVIFIAEKKKSFSLASFHRVRHSYPNFPTYPGRPGTIGLRETKH